MSHRSIVAAALAVSALALPGAAYALDPNAGPSTQTYYPWPEHFAGNYPSEEDRANLLKEVEEELARDEANDANEEQDSKPDSDGDGIPDEDDTINPFEDDESEPDSGGGLINPWDVDGNGIDDEDEQPAPAPSPVDDRSCTFKCLGSVTVQPSVVTGVVTQPSITTSVTRYVVR